MELRRHTALGVSLAAALAVCGLASAASLKSGLQPGDILTPFNVLNVNGPNAGESNCRI